SETTPGIPPLPVPAGTADGSGAWATFGGVGEDRVAADPVAVRDFRAAFRFLERASVSGEDGDTRGLTLDAFALGFDFVGVTCVDAFGDFGFAADTLLRDGVTLRAPGSSTNVTLYATGTRNCWL
ncbi:MAG: hypothetical protein V3W05_07895, partial [candidate division NC10 bacterium]